MTRKLWKATRPRLLTLVALAALGWNAAWGITLSPQAAGKVDANLRHVLFTEPTAEQLASSTLFRGGEVDGQACIAVLFSTTTVPVDLDAIEGLELGSSVGHVYTARLPLTRVEELALRPEVSWIEAAVILQPLLDESIPISNIDQVWGAGYTGQDVIVGVIDTGLNFEHDDFRNPNGTTRLMRLCHRDPGSGNEVCWNESSINIDLQGSGSISQVDTQAHGTHVMSTAGGNGRASSQTYEGVAKDATLISYKATNSGGGLPTNWVIDGISEIQTQANSAGLPAVINLSLGGHFGAHDGSSLMEEAIDAFSGPGRVVVSAAGNDGEQAIHFTGTSSFSKTITVTHVPPTQSVDYIWFEIWYFGSDNVSIRVQGPNGFDQTWASGSAATEVGNSSTGTVYCDNASQGSAPNGDKNCSLILGNTSGGAGRWGPANGDWTLTFTGATTGEVHGWLASQNYASGWVEDADYTHLIAIPGTSHETVGVGAYVSRQCWPSSNQQGTICTDQIWAGSWSSVRVGQAAPFTSPGPTRDGRFKPEISAPGMEIMAALSADADVNHTPPDFLTAPGGQYQILQGTSMAAPHVTGVVALLLDRDPQADPDAVKSALRRTATGVARRGAGITTILDENFEGSTAGWSDIDGGTTTGDGWAINSVWSYSPNNGAYVSANVVSQDETLVSPPIAMPAGQQITLDFWHGFEDPDDAIANHWVGVRTAGSQDAFTSLRTYIPSEIFDFPDPGLYWPWVHEVAVDLSDWAGQTVEIGWNYAGTNANGWFLDDVRVTAAANGEIWTPWFGYGKMDAKGALDVTPIDILSFRGVYGPDGVHVTWRVTDARSTLGFELQRAATRNGPYIPVHDGRLAPSAEAFVDHGVSPNRSYFYRLIEYMDTGSSTYGPIEVATHSVGGPPISALLYNSPNPFNPRTAIHFLLEGDAPVRLVVFDLAGRSVRTLVDGTLPSGRHAAEWDGRDDDGREMASGTYYYRLRTGETSQTRRMVLVR